LGKKDKLFWVEIVRMIQIDQLTGNDGLNGRIEDGFLEIIQN